MSGRLYSISFAAEAQGCLDGLGNETETKASKLWLQLLEGFWVDQNRRGTSRRFPCSRHWPRPAMQQPKQNHLPGISALALEGKPLRLLCLKPNARTCSKEKLHLGHWHGQMMEMIFAPVFLPFAVLLWIVQHLHLGNLVTLTPKIPERDMFPQCVAKVLWLLQGFEPRQHLWRGDLDESAKEKDEASGVADDAKVV